MKNLIKHSREILNKFFFVAFIVLIYACSKEKEHPDEYAAKVGDSYLTNTDIDSSLGSYKHNKKFRSEFIRQWIEKEVLYNEAIDEDIINDDEYIRLIGETKRELAGIKLIEKYFNENTFDFSEEDLNSYFYNNQDEFRKAETAYVINSACLKDELKAIDFRSSLMENGWIQTITSFNEDKSVLKMETAKVIYLSETSDVILSRMIEGLNKDEISIVFETVPGKFMVVQIVDVIQPNQTPDFKYIKNEVRDRFLMIQKKKLYQEYLEELYSKYEVEFAEK